MTARQRRTLLLGSTTIWGAVLALPAHAQDDAQAQSADQAGDDSDDNYGEIVVTGDLANRFGTDVVQSGSFRNAKVLDVPLTVSVIPSEVLKSQQAVDLMDAVRNTAGVSSSGVGPVAYNNLTVRGISVDTRANYKLDGALNILSSTAFPLENKDRVEVLKGASALYYGFSSPAGIVNLTMKRPTPDFYAYTRAFADSNGSLGQHVDVGDTVGIFGYRINALYAGLDAGIDYAKGRRYLVSGAFDLRPADSLTVTVDVEQFERRIAEPATIRVRYAPSETDGALPDLSRLDPRDNIAGAPWADNDTSEINVLGKAVWEFAPDWNLSGYYGFSHLTRIRNNPRFDPDRLAGPGRPSDLVSGDGQITYAAQNTRFENTNYAVELSGELHFGAFDNEILAGASRALRSLASPAAARVGTDQNFYDPMFIPQSSVNIVFAPRPPASQVDDKGIYAFDRLSWNDIVTVLGGIRYSDYSNDGSINAVTKDPYGVTSTSFSGGMVLKPLEWISLYGTYIEGLEETSPAPLDVTNALETFPPTVSRQYEAGLKLQPKPDLLFQAAYFDIKQGATYIAPDPAVPGQDRYFTDASNRYRGVEVSLTGYVTPDLALYATGTLLSAKYADNPDLDGLRVEGAPRNTWSLAGEYRVSWLDPGLKLTAGAYHTGSQAVNAQNNAFTDPYTTIDVGASYTLLSQGHEIVFRVNGQNITGKRYFASVGGGVFALNVPSAVKFSASFRF